MPDFTVEQWTSFKEQFLSVIRFIMYSFDLFFDTCRSNPMLYMFLFFPIFAVAFFVIFDLLKSLGSSLPSGSSSGSVTFASSKGGAAHRAQKAAAVNLAQSGKSVSVKDAQAGKLAANQIKAANNTSGVGKNTGLSAKDMMSNNKVASSGDTGVKLSTIGESIKNSVEDKQKRKEQDAAINEKVEQEQIEFANKRQWEEDKSFNLQTDYYYRKDEDGNSVTRTVVTNTRTGEVVSDKDSVKHVSD